MSDAAAAADTKDAAAAPAAAAPVTNVLSTPQKLSAGAARAAGLHGTPITPGQLSKPRQAPAGTPGQSATLKRALEAQEWTAELAVDLSKWFVQVLGSNTAMGDVKTADDFYARLQSGVELCNVINTIAPGEYNLPVNTDAKPKSFPAHDNVEQFLKAAKAMGVNSVSLFEVDDLMDRKNDKLVVNTLLQLSDCAQEQFGIPRVHLRDELRAALFGSPTKSSNAAAKLRGQATPAPAATGTAVTAAAHGVTADNAVVGSAHKRGQSRVGHAQSAHTGAVGVNTSAMVAGVEFGDDDDDAASAAARAAAAAEEHNRRHHRSGSGDDVSARHQEQAADAAADEDDADAEHDEHVHGHHGARGDGWGYRSGGSSSDSSSSDSSDSDSDDDDSSHVAAGAGAGKKTTSTAEASAQTDESSSSCGCGDTKCDGSGCAKCAQNKGKCGKAVCDKATCTGGCKCGDTSKCGGNRCTGKPSKCGKCGGGCKKCGGCNCAAGSNNKCGGGRGCCCKAKKCGGSKCGGGGGHCGGSKCGGGKCGVSGCHGCACKPTKTRRGRGGGGGGFFADDNLKVLVGLALTATHAFFYFNKRK